MPTTPPPVAYTAPEPTVQRSVEVDNNSVNDGTIQRNMPSIEPNREPSNDNDEQAADGSEAGADIDEIAQQVYQQLKRRLTVEYERLYRR